MKQNVREFLRNEGVKVPNNSSQDFWAFRKMVTPFLMQIIFWIGIIFVLFVGFISLAHGSFGARKNERDIIIGIFLILFGPLFVRVQCETIVVLFRINESLDEIKKNKQ